MSLVQEGQQGSVKLASQKKKAGSKRRGPRKKGKPSLSKNKPGGSPSSGDLAKSLGNKPEGKNFPDSGTSNQSPETLLKGLFEIPEFRRESLDKIPETGSFLTKFYGEMSSKLNSSVKIQTDHGQSVSTFLRLQGFIIEGIVQYTSSQTIDVEAVAGSIIQILQFNPSITVIESSKILRALKSFRRILRNCNLPEIREICQATHKVFLILKGRVIEHQLDGFFPQLNRANREIIQHEPEEVPDKALRKKVCRKIARILKDHKVEVEDSQKLALSIEANMRKKDPTMTANYKHLLKCMTRKLYKLIKI